MLTIIIRNLPNMMPKSVNQILNDFSAIINLKFAQL